MLHRNWEKHVNVDAVICSAVLSFTDEAVVRAQVGEVSFSKATEWLLDFGSQYLSYYGQYTVVSAREQLLREYMDFDSRQGPFLNIVSMIAEVRAAHEQWDARRVWQLYRRDRPAVCTVAMAVLSNTASEASVERTFSAQDTVHSKKRNRLLDTGVESEMFIQFNTIALRHRANGDRRQGSLSDLELNDDDNGLFVSMSSSEDEDTNEDERCDVDVADLSNLSAMDGIDVSTSVSASNDNLLDDVANPPLVAAPLESVNAPAPLTVSLSIATLVVPDAVQCAALVGESVPAHADMPEQVRRRWTMRQVADVDDH